MKVLFLTKYDNLGASSRYRTLQFLPYLQKRGIKYKVSPLFSNKYLEYKYNNKKTCKIEVVKALIKRIFNLINIKHYDLIVIEKELLPYFPPFFEKIIYRRKKPFVLDYDDAIFHNYDNNNTKIIRFVLKNKIKKVMELANLVIVGNSYLYDYAKNITDNVVLIPTVIDLAKYPTKKPVEPNIFTIGWIGSPATSHYILDILPTLEYFCLNNNCKLKLVGFDKKLLKNINNFFIKVVEWSEEKEIDYLKTFTVGIMPLKDDKWSRGKCGLKIIQYMGTFLPVIASPVGVNSDLIVSGVNGFLARDENEWLSSLEKLYLNKDLRIKMGYLGRKKVEEMYSLQVYAPKYIESILSVLK